MDDVGISDVWLRAQVKPLLREAIARPSMQEVLDGTMEVVLENENEPLPALLGSEQRQDPQDPFAKLFGF